MNWDQQALELWLEESARKDEDAMTLAKYAREDEGKVKELTLRLGRLTDEAADRKRKLNNEMMETQTTQVFYRIFYGEVVVFPHNSFCEKIM